MNSALRDSDWSANWDSFGAEASAFERDVHMLIFAGLDAAMEQLNARAKQEDKEILRVLAHASGEAAEHLAEEQADLWIQLSLQESFLRNMALVALMSRLTHSLLTMLRTAESWAPRVPNSYAGQDEFKRIWAELRSRFGLDLNSQHIGWIEPYRRARNRIVHNGGEADLMKSFGEIDFDAGVEGMYDMSFSKKYRAFVRGAGGIGAEIDVSEKLFEHAVKSALRLVKHVSELLRQRELEHYTARDVTAGADLKE